MIEIIPASRKGSSVTERQRHSEQSMMETAVIPKWLC